MTQPEIRRDPHALEAHDPDFHDGAAEKEEGGPVQILPVWASSQPMGYEGSPSDAQAVGGGEPSSAAETHAERQRLTLGGD